MSLFQQLFNNYNTYHVSEIVKNRFQPSRFYEVLKHFVGKYKLVKLGNSEEGRPIYSITIGNGPIKILLWSQMHGNESTATRALLDILQFFNEPGLLGEASHNLEDKLTICLVPILNPDGAERFQRRNALEIDINRDARAFVSSEARILKSIIEEFKPDFAFNLHDQRRFYNITGTAKPSSVAFLAPTYNHMEEINGSRNKAMQVIASIRQELETVIPGQVGLYDDSYSPRAFGDYCQAKGVSTILVESGWAANDNEKEFVRKLNFSSLISAFETIADVGYKQFTIEDYLSIPMNDEKLFDVLLRGVKPALLDKNSAKYDIGIQRTEITIPGSTDYYSVGVIADIGDLCEWHGFEEADAEGLFVTPGKIWPDTFTGMHQLTKEKANELLIQGYLFVNTNQKSSSENLKPSINVVGNEYKPYLVPRFEDKANFVLSTSEGLIKYIVLNGFLWDLNQAIPAGMHGLID